jgi:hypothetical protein
MRRRVRRKGGGWPRWRRKEGIESGGDGEGRSGSCGWKAFFFSFFFFFEKRMEGAGRCMDKLGWAVLMGLSSNFRSTGLPFLLLFKII